MQLAEQSSAVAEASLSLQLLAGSIHTWESIAARAQELSHALTDSKLVGGLIPMPVTAYTLHM